MVQNIKICKKRKKLGNIEGTLESKISKFSKGQKLGI